MAKQSPAQKETVERVMHEFKHGELETAGGKVRNPKQAIAIALSEAGSSNRVDPAANKRNLARTKRNERAGDTGRDEAEGTSKAALYEQAKRKNVPGRSKMSKAELQKAVRG